MNQQIDELETFDDAVPAIEPRNRVWLERGLSVGLWLHRVFPGRSPEPGLELDRVVGKHGGSAPSPALRSSLPILLYAMSMLLASVSTQAADLNLSATAHQPVGLDVYVEDMRNFALPELTGTAPTSVRRTHSVSEVSAFDVDAWRAQFRQPQFNVGDGLGTYTEDFKQISVADLSITAR